MFSEEREQKLKERLLAAFELSRSAKLKPKDEETKEKKSWFSGFFDQKVELVLPPAAHQRPPFDMMLTFSEMAGNTQIFLKNITIRYTDHVSADVPTIFSRKAYCSANTARKSI
jgi:hypothetical protein